MIKLAKPFIPEESISNVIEVIRSGNLIQGAKVLELENQISSYLSTPYVKAVSSGTAALHLSLLALDVKPGDEVIVPSFTFPATANVVELVGAKPVFVDIKLSDYSIDVGLIEEKITNKTKAIIPVHEFGQAADIIKVIEIANKYGLKVIEDAACALGTELNHRKVGTFGDIGTFSLHPRKNITTGEGGLVVCNNSDIARRIELLRSHGAKKENGRVDFLTPGLNYRMTDIHAAIGIPQARMIDNLIASRIKQAEFYNSQLLDIPWIRTPEIIGNRKHTFQTYHLLLEGKDRDAQVEILKKAGIESSLGAQALNCLSFYSNKYNLSGNDFPNATDAYRNGIALPLGWHVDTDMQIKVCETLIKSENQ